MKRMARVVGLNQKTELGLPVPRSDCRSKRPAPGEDAVAGAGRAGDDDGVPGATALAGDREGVVGVVGLQVQAA